MADPKNPWIAGGGERGEAYEARFEALEAAGVSPHGEAEFVAALAPRSVLDAGCGTGRVARELARRGIDVVGIDLDDQMLATAREKAPELRWVHGDLTDPGLDLGRTFEVVVAAGNVMIFLTPGTEAAALVTVARHLEPGGRFVAGFQLGGRRLSLVDYDAHATAAGLVLEARYGTWDGEPFVPGGDYAVSVHRLPAA